MDSLLLPLAVTALILPLAYLAVPPALAAWRRRRERGKISLRPAKSAGVVIPPADETARTVERFHRALMRTELADFLRPDSSSGA